MRTHVTLCLAVAGVVGCAKAVQFGPLEGSATKPNIIAVDSALPPKNATVVLERDGYVVLLLIAPGHSATLLYPRDSTTDNRMTAGTHEIAFEIPRMLVLTDSMRAAMAERNRQRFDSAAPARPRTRVSGTSPPPLLANTPTYFLLITSPKRLIYSRVLDKTAGVSIPLVEMEAVSAIGKAVKSTIDSEPREISGWFQLVELVRTTK